MKSLLWSFFALGALSACSPTMPSSDASLDVLDATDESASDVAPMPDVPSVGPAAIITDWSLTGGFFRAPFPGEQRRNAQGRPDLTGFPNARSNPYGSTLLQLVAGSADGFALTASVYFQLNGAPDTTRFPSVVQSVQPTSPVFLLSVDPMAPDFLKRSPARVTFLPDAGPFGDRNLLSIQPAQGIPLRPNTLYAAVVLRDLRASNGDPIGVPPALQELLAGRMPSTFSASAAMSYRTALDALQRANIATNTIAGLTVFRTGNPTAQFERFRTAALQRGPLQTSQPFTRTELFNDYCVYTARLRFPVYQRGTPPYDREGGDWVENASGPMMQREEEARLVLTVPRRTMPMQGYPLVVFSRTGGGGDRPLVDRGRHPMAGAAAEPGSGPAMWFARAGWAGIMPDGPLGGIRNPNMSDEQFLVFNFNNPIAMRDNVRQSALELTLLTAMLPTLTIPTSDCPGASPMARFDVSTLTLMGHSMGASIAPLAVAFEPRYRAMLLSGAGASWLENVIHKQKPIPVRPLADLLVGYRGTGRSLTEDDPVLSLLQWGGEAMDSQVYARYLIAEPPQGSQPRHILMMQGIVDRYILPPIANSLSLSAGLDLAGTPLDTMTPEISRFVPLGTWLPLVERRTLDFPVQGNRTVGGMMLTTVVTQHREDGLEDGHEVAFQTDTARRQYRCFLESFARGVPRVPAPGPLEGACE